MITLTNRQARQFILRKQGLLGADLLLVGRYFYLERKIAGRKIEK